MELREQTPLSVCGAVVQATCRNDPEWSAHQVRAAQGLRQSDNGDMAWTGDPLGCSTAGHCGLDAEDAAEELLSRDACEVSPTAATKESSRVERTPAGFAADIHPRQLLLTASPCEPPADQGDVLPAEAETVR